MGLLVWEKPQQVTTPEAHANRYQSDSGIPGTYANNMSPEDEIRWRAKSVFNVKVPRVEIRKTLGVLRTKLKLVVTLNENAQADVQLTANGVLRFDACQFTNLQYVVEEAADALWKHHLLQMRKQEQTK